MQKGGMIFVMILTFSMIKKERVKPVWHQFRIEFSDRLHH